MPNAPSANLVYKASQVLYADSSRPSEPSLNALSQSESESQGLK